MSILYFCSEFALVACMLCKCCGFLIYDSFLSNIIMKIKVFVISLNPFSISFVMKFSQPGTVYHATINYWLIKWSFSYVWWPHMLSWEWHQIFWWSFLSWKKKKLLQFGWGSYGWLGEEEKIVAAGWDWVVDGWVVGEERRMYGFQTLLTIFILNPLNLLDLLINLILFWTQTQSDQSNLSLKCWQVIIRRRYW